MVQPWWRISNLWRLGKFRWNLCCFSSVYEKCDRKFPEIIFMFPYPHHWFYGGTDDTPRKISKTFWGLWDLWLEIREPGDTCVVTITSFPYHTCRDGGTRLVNSLLCTWFKLMEFGFLKSGFINWKAQLGSQVEMQYSSEY